MKYQEFVDHLKEHILEYLPESYADAEVSVNTYYLYGEMREDILISQHTATADKARVSPVLNIEPLYSAIQIGASLETVMHFAADAYMDGVKHGNSLGLPQISRDNILQNLFSAAVNYEKTDLSNMPHLRVNDLAIIAKCQIFEKGAITVTDELAEYVGIDGEELVSMAMENNTKKAPPIISDLHTVAIYGEPNGVEVKELTPDFFMKRAVNPCWYLSNTARRYGASLIADTDTLHKISEAMGSDLIILPASIHELLIMPEEEADELGDLKSLVEEVNSEITSDKIFLSNNVYKYIDASREIKIYDTQLQKELDRAREQKPSVPRL